VKKVADVSVPDGIIVHLTQECYRNVHGHNVLEVASSKSISDELQSDQPLESVDHWEAFDLAEEPPAQILASKVVAWATLFRQRDSMTLHPFANPQLRDDMCLGFQDSSFPSAKRILSLSCTVST
jgi:hypothetical protein